MENFYINLLKDTLPLLLTAIGLLIANSGLQTWKKQIKGTKQYETAYNLNFSVLKLRDAINHVRHPAIWPSESARGIQYARDKYPNKTVAELEGDAHSYVYEMRWEEITIASTEMESQLLAAQVLWGKEVSDLIKPLYGKRTELNVNLKKMFQHLPEKNVDDYAKRDEIVYGGLNDDEENTYTKELNLVINQIGNYLRKKMS